MKFTGKGKTHTDAIANLVEAVSAKYGFNIHDIVGVEETIDNVQTFPPDEEVRVHIERNSAGSAGYMVAQTTMGTPQIRLFIQDISPEVKSKHGLFDYLEITHINGYSLDVDNAWDIYSREAIGKNSFDLTLVNHPFTVAVLTQKIKQTKQ